MKFLLALTLSGLALAQGRLPNVHDQGIVIRHGGCPGACDDLGARDPWVYKSGNLFYMTYDGASSSGWFASLATSAGGRHWSKAGTVLKAGAGHPDSASASYGTTFYAASKYTNRWIMYYLGTPNYSDPANKIPTFPYLTLEAESNSPWGPWTKHYEKQPFATVAGTYYSLTASPGQIIERDGEYFMFFSASAIVNGKVKRTIGIARSLDLIRWDIDSSPVVPPDEQIENSSLYYDRIRRTWYLFVNHVGTDASGVKYTDSVRVYYSTYLLHWNALQKRTVLDYVNTIGHYKCVGLPSVTPVGRQLFVFYDTPGGSSISHMGRDIGLATIDLPLK
jgi:predicted GH43/DUF377 family glycosyl hydrolase